MTKVPVIQMEELEKQLADLGKIRVEGFSIAEMSANLDISEPRCRVKLKTLITASKVRSNGTRPGTRIDGRACATPVYLMLEESSNEL